MEDRKCFGVECQESKLTCNINNNHNNNHIIEGVTLNTKGCCLICLNEGSIKASDFALLSLLEILKVSPETIIALENLSIATGEKCNTDNQSKASKSIKAEMNGTLCEYCGDYLQSLLESWLQLKKLQLHMDHQLERIHKRILASYENTGLVQNYSKRMTSDVKSLSQLPVLDRLRKEIREQSSLVRFAPQLLIKLTRLSKKDLPVEKAANSHGQSIAFIDDNFPLEEGSGDSVPVLPRPPITINIKEENFRAELDLDDTFAHEDDYNSFEQSLPPPPPQIFPPQPSTQLNFKKHLRCSLNPQTGKWKCSECPLEFTHRSHVARHYRACHLLFRYKCEICHKDNFSQLENLKQHKKKCNGVSETPSKNFSCKICKRKFTERWACKAHMLECVGGRTNQTNDN